MTYVRSLGLKIFLEGARISLNQGTIAEVTSHFPALQGKHYRDGVWRGTRLDEMN